MFCYGQLQWGSALLPVQQSAGRILLAVLFGVAALGSAQAGGRPWKVDPEIYAWGLLQHGESYLRIRPASPETALRYFERAAATDIPWVVYDVAERYRKGVGIPKDPRRALDLYQQIIRDEECTPASKTCAWAKFQAGDMLRKGEGARQDTALARKLLEDAVQQTNDQWPKLALAELLAESGEQDATALAFALYRESAADGNTYAAEGLSSLCKRRSLAQC